MEYYRENNKLIAEFMELPTEVFKSGKVNYYFREFNSGTWYEEHELSYNVSWDWLMPVSQKIDKYFDDNLGEIAYLDDCLLSNDIDVRYQAVVEFIEWYNSGGKYTYN
jgi:hypothetical protein